MSQPEEEFVPTDDTFAALLRSAEDGVLVNALGGEVRAAIKHLGKHANKTNRRAKGVLTLKIKLEVDGKGYLETEGDFSVKLPKLSRARSFHWTDEDGDILNRRPERQLELKGINGGAPVAVTIIPTAPVKDVQPAPVKSM